MGILKTTSSQSLLQKTGTNFGLNNSNWHGNGVDWIGDAIKGIGYHTGFDKKTVYLNVKNYKVKIEDSIETITSVRYNDIPLAVGYDYDNILTNSKTIKKVASYHEVVALAKEVDRLKALQLSYAAVQVDTTLDAIVESLGKVERMTSEIGLGASTNNYEYDWYSIEGGYIKTSFQQGEIAVKANLFMLDDKGYPLVVDTFKYTEAVQWFIMYRLCLSGYQHPELNWKECKSVWEDYRGQASNEAKMFSSDEMERFSDRWSSVKRNIQSIHCV